MPTTTPKLNLLKPHYNDAANLEQYNENWNKLDDAMLSDGSVPMTSDLHINKPEYPQIFLEEESTDSHARLQLHDGGLMIDSVPSSENADTSRYIMLYGGGDLGGAIRLVDNQNGVKKWYSLYGEHNVTNLVKIATGEYKGSDKKGSSYPNALTFPFTPKMVVIWETATQGGSMPWIYGCTQLTTMYGTGAFKGITATWTDNTLSWYSSDSIGAQLNYNKVYKWVAIG